MSKRLVINKDSIPLSSSGNADGRPAYGLGSRGYGPIHGLAVRGREVQKQGIIQNTGSAPALSNSAARFSPSLWLDLNLQGVPFVMQGLTLIGAAQIETAAQTVVPGESDEAVRFTHQIMAANGGVRQKLVYSSDDEAMAVDLDSYFTATDGSATEYSTENERRVNGEGLGTSTVNFVSGNKPFAYNTTHEHSSAASEVTVNYKVTDVVNLSTTDNVMFPVSNGYAYGGINTNGLTLDNVSGSVVTRQKLGFGDVVASTNVAINTFAAVDAEICGIQAGDSVMANPWLPGTLISTDDFITIAVAQDADSDVLTSVNAKTGGVTKLHCAQFASEQRAGRCIKRQARTQINNTAGEISYSRDDLPTSTYKFVASLPGLGMSGSDSQGIAGNQHDAHAYAISQTANDDTQSSVDVMFINFNLK